MIRRCAVLLLSISACHRSHPAAGPIDAGPLARPELPAEITVDDTRTDLIFSYQDTDGTFRDVQKSADVPLPFRKHVMVRDLSRRPEELHADELLYVADLTAKEDGGRYRYAVVSRYRFRLPQVSVEVDGGFSETVVTLYGTSWCGACAQARNWFETHGVTFIDKDIEKDEAAARELAQKAKRAGVDFRGVPVIDVKGHLFEGFDPGAVQQALRGG
jgi:glutaredoxin